MNSQTVRAVLAYSMVFLLLVCLVISAVATMTQQQATMVGTVIGAILASAKMPLAYFYDGVATAEQESAPPAPPILHDVIPEPNGGAPESDPAQARPAPAK